MFAKLAGRYLHRWTSAFPSPEALAVAKQEWADRLAGLSGDEIARGLAVWREAWPPCADEFRAACRPRMAACHQAFPRLPKPLADPAVAAEQIRAMRDVLRGVAHG